MRDSKGRFVKNNSENKKYNKYDLKSFEYGVGYTLKGEEFYFDLEDYDKIKDYCWNVSTRKENNYKTLNARDCKNNKTVRFANIIMNSKYVDHINKNTLDNRKSNLRICSQNQNSRNQSKPYNSNCPFMGVSFINGKYYSRIGVNKKKIHLGTFNTLEEAIIVRLKAEKEYFGEFAPQKELFEKYGITDLCCTNVLNQPIKIEKVEY